MLCLAISFKGYSTSWGVPSEPDQGAVKTVVDGRERLDQE